jgi:hypothetical protein
MLGACHGAGVDVRNDSPARLEEVVISANGDSATIESIEPGTSRAGSLCPKGEAGELELSFRADGKPYRSKTPVYFECDSLYRLQVDVSSTFEAARPERHRIRPE